MFYTYFDFFFHRYPFDWETFIGYLACWILQVPPVLATAELFIYTLLLPIGFCLFLEDFISDIEENLHQLSDDLHRIGENLSNIEQKIEIKMKFFDIMEFHSEARQLSVQFLGSSIPSHKHFLAKLFENRSYLPPSQPFKRFKTYFSLPLNIPIFRFANQFSNINSGIIFVYLLYFLISFCSAILQINIVIKQKLNLLNEMK